MTQLIVQLNEHQLIVGEKEAGERTFYEDIQVREVIRSDRVCRRNLLPVVS